MDYYAMPSWRLLKSLMDLKFSGGPPGCWTKEALENGSNALRDWSVALDERTMAYHRAYEGSVQRAVYIPKGARKRNRNTRPRNSSISLKGLARPVASDASKIGASQSENVTSLGLDALSAWRQATAGVRPGKSRATKRRHSAASYGHVMNGS